jgi:hypothetical protein
MQRTIILDYNGQKVVSNPFRFKHACIVDDERYKFKLKEGDKSPTDGEYNRWAFNALQSMFEGTILTDEILETEINIKEVRNACIKILNWYFGINDEVKNSSSPQAEKQAPEVGV